MREDNSPKWPISGRILSENQSFTALKGETVVRRGDHIAGVIADTEDAKAFISLLLGTTPPKSKAELTAETFLSRAELTTLRDAMAALQFLAIHDRPSGGEQTYNYAWLLDRADRLNALIDRHTPPPAMTERSEPLKAGDVLGTLKVGKAVTSAEKGEILGVAFNPLTGETRTLHEDDMPPEVREAFAEMGLDNIGEVKPTADPAPGGFQSLGDVIETMMAGISAALADDERNRIMTAAVKDRVKAAGTESMGLPWELNRVYMAGDCVSHNGALWTFWPQHGEDPEEDVYGFGINGIEPGSEGDPEWWHETASDFDLSRCNCTGCQIAANAEPHLKAQRDAIDAASAEKAEEALKAAETPAPAAELTAPDWDRSKSYIRGDRVAHEGQVWEVAYDSVSNGAFFPGSEASEDFARHNDGKPVWVKVENTTAGLELAEKTA